MTRATFTPVPAPIDALPNFCGRAPYTTPADDLAKRLDGFRLDSSGVHALAGLLAERHGKGGAVQIARLLLRELER